MSSNLDHAVLKVRRYSSNGVQGAVLSHLAPCLHLFFAVSVVKLHDVRADSVMPSKVEKFILLPGSCALAILMMEIIVRIFDILPRPLDPLPVSTYRLSANPIILDVTPGISSKNE